MISETERTVDMVFWREFVAFKKKCKKAIAMSFENSKIHVENLEKEISSKENIIHQLLLSFQNISP